MELVRVSEEQPAGREHPSQLLAVKLLVGEHDSVEQATLVVDQTADVDGALQFRRPTQG
jgi:hypothetical protein